MQDNRNDKESFQEPLQKCIRRAWSAQSPGQETLTRYLDGSGAVQLRLVALIKYWSLYLWGESGAVGCARKQSVVRSRVDSCAGVLRPQQIYDRQAGLVGTS